MRKLTTRKGRSVDTPFSNEEALARLREMYAEGRAGRFGADLVRKSAEHGLSVDQMTWVHILVVEAEEPKRTVKLEAIVRVLQRARDNGLKHPKVRLSWGNGEPLALSLAGERSRYPGTVNVTDGGSYGNNRWFGRIELDGDYSPRRGVPAEVVEALEKFNAAPAETGSLHGRLTGRCCFCGRDLETKESVGVGYGPVCADRYGLPWGRVDLYQLKKDKAIEVESTKVDVKADRAIEVEAA
ncbi:MAG: hypothetical protein JSW58_08525 [Candidatus Latescibacterota bacterium]|nr:MAG: hypothetical protein JSW58_08525 [Candidatus Latescibacterota bacterium]